MTSLPVPTKLQDDQDEMVEDDQDVMVEDDQDEMVEDVEHQEELSSTVLSEVRPPEQHAGATAGIHDPSGLGGVFLEVRPPEQRLGSNEGVPGTSGFRRVIRSLKLPNASAERGVHDANALRKGVFTMAVPSTLRSGLVERTEELTTSAPLFKSSLTSEPSVERVTLLQQERMEEENVVDLMLPLSTSSTTGPRDESQNFSEKSGKRRAEDEVIDDRSDREVRKKNASHLKSAVRLVEVDNTQMSLEFQKRSHELEMQKMNEDFQTRVGELNHHHDIEKKQLERNIEDAAAEISRVSRQLELLQTPENSKTLEAYDTTHSLQGRISELETEVSRSKLSFDKMERLFKDATKKHDYLEAQQRKEREKETEIVNQQQLLLERTKELSTERESRETEIKRMQVEMDLAKQANNSLASSQERLKAELDEKIIELQRELAAEKQICKTAMELMKAEKDLETQAKDSLASTQERLKAQLDEKIAEHQRELAAEKQICKTEMERMKAEKDLETRAKDSLASSQERLRRTLEEKEKHSSEQKRLILGWEEELAAAKQGHETEMERMKAEKDLETRAKDSLASSHERLRTTLDEKEKHSNEQKRLLLERERELAAAEVTHDTALQAVQREKAVLLLRAQEAEDTVRKQREEFLQRANATAVEQDQSLATEREQLVHREDHLRHEKELIEAQRASLIARETDLASESRRCKEVLEAQHQSLLVREAEVDKQAQRLKELNSAAKGKGVDVGENHAGGLGTATGSDTAAPSTSTSSAGFAQGSGVGSATTTATTSAAATSGQCFTTRAGRKAQVAALITNPIVRARGLPPGRPKPFLVPREPGEPVSGSSQSASASTPLGPTEDDLDRPLSLRDMLAITKQFASAGAIHSTTLYENSSRKSTTKGGRQRRYMVDPEIDLDNVKIPVPFKNGEPPLAPQDRNLLMAKVRLAYETVLNFGLQTGREFYQVTPANSNKCWAYNENPTNEGPNPDTLQFDAAAHNTAWNQRCIEIMAQKIRDDKERFMLPDTVTDKQLYEILLSRWQKLHGKWNETNARMLPTGRFETVQEVASRISKAKVNIKHSENARSRRRTKFQTRKEIVKEEIEGLNRGNPNDEQELRFWTWLLEVLVHLDVEGMSSTESDTIQATGDRVYFTHLVGWRRQEIGEKLRKVDERRDAIKNAAGNRPVTKTYTNQPSRRKHRDGLPRIIYDQEWLASNEKTLRVKVSEEQMEFLDYILPSMTRNS